MGTPVQQPNEAFMSASAYRLTSQRIDLYCKVRLADLLPQDDLDRLRDYLDDCLTRNLFPPYRGRAIDIGLIADAAGIEPHVLASARAQIQPICDAICRALADQPLTSPASKQEPRRRTRPAPSAATTADREPSSALRAKPGPKPRPIEEHPEPLWTEWEDRDDFASALALHITRHGETVGRLARAITATGVFLDRITLDKWVKGTSSPSSLTSLQALDQIEHRYRLPAGSLRAKLPRSGRAARGNVLDDIPRPERRRLAWHLPEDFSRKPIVEQEEILTWVRTTIISGTTDYRRYQAAAQRQRFAVRFTGLDGARRRTKRAAASPNSSPLHPRFAPAANANDEDTEPGMVVDAPARLQREMTDLLRFKTATLTAFGLRRSGVWNPETASQKVEHFGLMFGAFAASPAGEIRGHGVELSALTFAMLLFPRVWDWYLQWREERRGFYTRWELDLLAVGLSLLQKETGWIRQMPRLGDHLVPISGLVTEDDIAVARADWNGAST
ncbi:hypothetical protein ASG54_03390 [Aureimonas sp. Leaf460]|nr:hypothetical protein ASG62_21430 [Aureimonas sp. Leaf427]KQT78075.1 hypothetical protein ASG54_03390 [Aureimonas sp. Leaf460]